MLPRSASNEYLNHPDRLTKKFVGINRLTSIGLDKYAISMKTRQKDFITLQCKRKDAELIYWLFGKKVPSILA